MSLVLVCVMFLCLHVHGLRDVCCLLVAHAHGFFPYGVLPVPLRMCPRASFSSYMLWGFLAHALPSHLLQCEVVQAVGVFLVRHDCRLFHPVSIVNEGG